MCLGVSIQYNTVRHVAREVQVGFTTFSAIFPVYSVKKTDTAYHNPQQAIQVLHRGLEKAMVEVEVLVLLVKR
jgi:hypothetical protein